MKLKTESSMRPNAPGFRGNRFSDKQKHIINEALLAGQSRTDIAHLHHCSKKTITRMRRSLRLSHAVSNPFALKTGRRRVLTAQHLAFVDAELRRCPTLYLDELEERLQVAFDGEIDEVSLKTLDRSMHQFGISRKRMKPQARERSELVRTHYQHRAGAWDAENICFIDESGINDRDGQRRYGYSRVGVPCIKKYWFNHGGKRISFIPVLSLDGMEYCKVLEANGSQEVFLEFLMELAEEGILYPGRVVVMDNASIHHGAQIRAIVEGYCQCHLVFLPPYSPDLNPIEEAFATVKQWIRRNEDRYHEASDAERRLMIHLACIAITPEQAEGWFRHAGYV
ncbi:hypothetical protein P7C70_g4759, partial [Phenoliferia sp. Uapishka_3]